MKVTYLPYTIPEDTSHPIVGRWYSLKDGSLKVRVLGLNTSHRKFYSTHTDAKYYTRVKLKGRYGSTFDISLAYFDCVAVLLPIPLRKRLINAITRKVGEWIPRWLRWNSKPIH